MHPLFRCGVAKLVDYPESPQFDVAAAGYFQPTAHPVIRHLPATK
jgi:hypothetical protein